MKRISKQTETKLRSRRGETIAEVLVALLISALGLVLLAGMIGTATRLITDSRAQTEAYIEAENALAAQSGSGKAGTVGFSLGSTPIRLADGEAEAVPVAFFTNGGQGDKAILSYKVRDDA